YAFLRRRYLRPVRPRPRSVNVAGSGTADAVKSRTGSLLRIPTVPAGPTAHEATSTLKKELKRASLVPNGVKNQSPLSAALHGPGAVVSTLRKPSEKPLPPGVDGLMLLTW